MRSLAAASLGVASLLVTACAGNTEPDVAISGVSPAAAYDREKVPIVIAGGPFRPVYEIQTGAGHATTQLGSFTGFIAPRTPGGTPLPFDELTWVSSTELLAVVPAAVPEGQYDVVVRDPRGLVARLDDAFQSLGPDTDEPEITIMQPPEATIVLVGTQVPVAVLVSDAPGRLKNIRWNAATGASSNTPRNGFCPVGPVTEQTMCRFTFMAPEPSVPGEPLIVTITAEDWAANVHTVTRTVALSAAPTVTKASPMEGPAAGGTEIVVTGTNFVPGTQVLIDGVVAPLVDNGLEAGRTLRVRTPPHEPGFVEVSVRAGSAEVQGPIPFRQFRYVGRPIVLAVGPSQGPVTGGTRVAIVGKFFREGATRIFFGTSDGQREAPLVCPKLISTSRIEGFTPPGTGAMSIFARDPIGGEGVLPIAFTYLEVDTPGVAPPGPPPCHEGAP
jgi:hypothetical protein